MTTVSYATQDQARAYVARVLARPVPARKPRIYVICRPDLRDKLAPMLRGMARTSLRGAVLVSYPDVLGDVPGKTTATDRVPLIAAASDGALVVPRFWGCRTLVGRAAAAEAQGLADLGLPVLVNVPGRLAAWCDVATREPDDPPPYWAALELDLPAVPQTPLPTVLASLRALGLPR